MLDLSIFQFSISFETGQEYYKELVKENRTWCSVFLGCPLVRGRLSLKFVLGDEVYEEDRQFVEQLKVHQMNLFYIGHPFT